MKRTNRISEQRKRGGKIERKSKTNTNTIKEENETKSNKETDTAELPAPTCSGLRLNGPSCSPPVPVCSGTTSYHMALASIDKNNRAKQEPTR